MSTLFHGGPASRKQTILSLASEVLEEELSQSGYVSEKELSQSEEVSEEELSPSQEVSTRTIQGAKITPRCT